MDLILTVADELARGLGWGLIVGATLVFALYYLRPSESEYVIDVPEQQKSDAWEGIDRARMNHPSPDAHSELKALEVDGPVHVFAAERVVKAR